MTDKNLKMQNCERAANSTNKTNAERKEDWITSAEDSALRSQESVSRAGKDSNPRNLK